MATAGVAEKKKSASKLGTRQNRPGTDDRKEEKSKASQKTQKTQKSTTPRKRTSNASQEKINPEADAVIAEFVQQHVNLDVNTSEYEQQLITLLPADQEHQKCCQTKERNRYETVPCLDATRVVVQQDSPSDCDFIHANRCKFDGVDRQYIIAQAPMKNTVEDFWRMIFQEQSAVVVVLCDFYENGHESAEAFWPMTSGQYIYHGKMFINNKKTELSQGKDEVDTYAIEVLPDGCSNSLLTTLYHWKWPAGSPLPSSHVLLNIVRLVKRVKEAPLTVISSQGIGRAATFVVVDVVLLRLFKGNKARMVAVALELRKQRALAFQNGILYYSAIDTVLKYIKVRVKKHVDAVKKYIDSYNQMHSNK